MTEMKEVSGSIKYFGLEDIEAIHSTLAETFKEDGEPIPPFSTANENNVDALIKIPKSNYFGVEQYPTIESKAAIIFYTVNKKHIFPNANKRMSVLCLSVFLEINGKRLEVAPEELRDKAIWLAKTTHEHDFSEIKDDLEKWISEHIK